MKAKSIEILKWHLAQEEVFTIELRDTIPAQQLAARRKLLCTHLRTVTHTGDLALIIATEKEILMGDLERYANSPAMVRSLRMAIEEMELIEQHLKWVTDVESYRFINQTHAHHSTRQGTLPRDDARLALASHKTRLANLDRSRLNEDEKALIDARRAGIETATEIYIGLQLKLLGL